MRILTKELVERAVELVCPAAKEILFAEGTTWGPKWVEGRVEAPGLEEMIKFDFGEEPHRFGEPARKWRREWGEEIYFGEIAEAKLRVVMREGVNASLVVATKPWLLKGGEYLYAGGVYRDGIAVAVSGAKSATDEAIAEMVVSSIVMLAMLETERRQKEGKEQI